MRIADITSSEQLRRFMTEPTQGLVATLGTLPGQILVLGASGKMGPELVEMAVRADQQAGVPPRIKVAARFSGERGQETLQQLHALGVETLRGDLTDPVFLDSLPRTENLVYMVGFKFGSSADPGRAIQMNCVVPAQIAMAYPQSRIVVFSSGNPYAPTEPEQGGSKEGDLLAPQGIYGWSVVGRETAFRATASGHPRQKICFYRLMYAQHLAYGVVVDLAKLIRDQQPISLAVPYVNLVSQRDANDRALRALEICSNPPAILNVSGPIVSVKYLTERLAEYLDQQPRLVETGAEAAPLADDSFCRERFGPYRDAVDDMIEAAARWVMSGGEDWDKPTMFGEVQAGY